MKKYKCSACGITEDTIRELKEWPVRDCSWDDNGVPCHNIIRNTSRVPLP